MSNITYPKEKPIFYAVSSLAGTGKTTSAIKYIAQRASQGQLFIVANPSLDKTNENFKKLEQLNVSSNNYHFNKLFNLRVITSQSHSGIEKALSSTMSELHKIRLETGIGGVILVTHEGLLISSDIARQDTKPFHLIWDETTSIIFHIEGTILKEMKAALFDNVLEVNEKNGIFTGNVNQSAVSYLKKRLKEQGIGIRDSEEVQSINKHLLNSAQGFCDILLGGNIENQVSMIFVYNHLKFHGYQSVTFIGAHLEMTNMHQWFAIKGVEWQVHKDIMKEINLHERHNFNLTIYYGNKSHNHTRNFLDKTNKENKTFRSLFIEKTIEVIGDKKTLVMKNISDDFFYPQNFEICPWKMEGMNSFQEFESALYIGSFNQHPAFYSLIEKLGLKDYAAPLHLYQFILRLACREKNFSGTIELYLPCLKLFEPIAHLFDRTTVNYIPMELEFEEALDERKDNGNYNTTVPCSEWYEIESRSKMIKFYNFPFKKSKTDYIKWFEEFGYKSEIIEEKVFTRDRHKKIKKHLIVYKTNSGLEEAKLYFC